jgi:hypothetical protein
MLVLAVGPNSQQGLINTIVIQQAAAKAGAGSVLNTAADDEGLALLEVGSGSSKSPVTSWEDVTAAAEGGQGEQQSREAAKRLEAAAAAASAQGGGLREQTPLGAKLEVLAGQIGALGFTAAGAVLAINALLFTWERMAAGLSVSAPEALEVRGAGGRRVMHGRVHIG